MFTYIWSVYDNEQIRKFPINRWWYTFMNLALEIAIANKLHLKEPFENYPEEDREVFKRLWWTCYTMERRHGVNIGRVETIAPEDITVELPVDTL